MAVFTALSRYVRIENIRVRNAATWAVVNLEVEHLAIRGIDVDSPLGPTHDGIDIVDGHDVLIENRTVNDRDARLVVATRDAVVGGPCTQPGEGARAWAPGRTLPLRAAGTSRPCALHLCVNWRCLSVRFQHCCGEPCTSKPADFSRGSPSWPFKFSVLGDP